ncbi:MAG: GHMP kinase [Candidatus Marinimicrobia bacterium]|nr:GHMP kinase [Candidatus Neomarinimicrobiota bacterium]MBL7010832.1 GHMP kinase [Candidatus Neomarinimicrobiota bacterium]MBL7030120.1 GHMP kinase [Candidatus Neomarinimicrobiota bacterium]
MIISTPGRLCLFGEHQDYLGLPVIAMAISLRAKIKGEKRKDKKVIIHKIDLSETESFTLEDLTYTKPRDYFKSGINVCQREGLTFSSGLECEIASEIPIRSGASSSSAIMVSWIHFLSRIADDPVVWDQQKMGELAYKAEVTEFNESGGMMDQYSVAMGKTIYLESEPTLSIRTLNSNLGAFVLGDSCEPKDTMGILNRCRDSRIDLIQKLKNKNPDQSIHTMDEGTDLRDLSADEIELFNGTLKNRELLKDGLVELEKDEADHELIGRLLTEHHQVLRDVLQVSTPKIESMIDAALNAGALGGKINGSGGGGCMFAYAPNNLDEIAKAIEKVGGRAYIIEADEGTIIK